MKRKMLTGGWILKVVLFLFMVVASARGKFFDWDGREEMFNQMGFSLETMFKIGVLEVIVSILFLLPGRMGLLGALLLTGYLGGAVAVHVRVGDVFFFPVLVGALAWLSVFLTNNDFRDLLLKNKNSK